LSLGSNIGDRAGNLRAAISTLDSLDGVQLMACSSSYETEPVGGVEQPAFLNVAAEIETDLEPLELLDAVKDLERRAGRQPTVRWGPRVLDVDIVLWDARQVATKRLTIPHEEFRTRAFVLAPLAEIAPEAVDPVTGMTVAELAVQPGVQGRVERVGALEAPR
jgi:2-amino-4-hydroxy-6-hydroxymethyldihydropteridine diphosphokinase